MNLGVTIAFVVLAIVCSFGLGWQLGKPKPEPEFKPHPQFKYNEMHKHTHEGGKHRGIRTYTPVWGPDYDFQYDAKGTHTHKHDESDIRLTHAHWRLDKTEPVTTGAVIGIDHRHPTLKTQSKSENWRSSNGDWVHDHHYGYISELRTLLYITHSHF